jgi:Domain of unknown function (DUF1772)
MVTALGVVSALACAWFAGAAAYVTWVEHPARLSCGTEAAVREWRPSYKRGAVMQASLAILATLAGLARYFLGGGGAWLWGSIAIGVLVPYTLVVIYPTNQQLLEPGRDLGSEETRELLDKWARLHAVRTGLGLLASILLVGALGHGGFGR